MRPKGDSYRAGAFKIRLDHLDQGYLPALASRTFEVDAGIHELRVQFHWYRSPLIRFEIDSSESATFQATIPKSFATVIRLLITPWCALNLDQIATTSG